VATVSLSTSPTTLDSGTSDNVSVTNTGSVAVVVSRGSFSTTLQPGQGTVVYPEGAAVTGVTVSGSGQVTTVATAARVSQQAQFAADPAFTGTYTRRFRSYRPHPSLVDSVMASPPTIGAITTTSAAAITWSVNSQVAAGPIGYGNFTFRGCGNIVSLGSGSPDNIFVKAKHLTDPVSTYAPFNVDFLFDGTYLEIRGKGAGGKARVRVDGQLISATPTTFTNDGSTYLLPLTFGARAVRRITVEADSSFAFGGVRTNATDTIVPAPVASPRCIVLGDSFTDGTGATAQPTNWVRRFAEAMGWADTWASGLGGTGYLNPGSGGRVKFRDRVAADVIAYSPDVVIVAGGLNEVSGIGAATYTASQLQTEAAALFTQIKAGLPNALLVVVSPFWRNGVETYNAAGAGALLAARDAIKTAAVAAGAIFLDVLELPLAASVSTTLAASASSSATTVSLTDPVPIRSTIGIGSGGTYERRVVTALSGTGPYSATVAALTYAHNSAEAVATVGASLWTGTGKAGATTGAGNSDLIVISDGTHPSQAGHELIGSTLARMLDAALGNA
jgi:lysophospholipase L1-like esterase